MPEMAPTMVVTDPEHLNCSGIVDLQDLTGFVLAGLDPLSYQGQFPSCFAARADMNHDAVADGRDVQLFVEAMLE